MGACGHTDFSSGIELLVRLIGAGYAHIAGVVHSAEDHSYQTAGAADGFIHGQHAQSGLNQNSDLDLTHRQVAQLL